MGKETGIAWTDATFNPWWGCTKVDACCTNCYAEALATRWGFTWGPKQAGANCHEVGPGHGSQRIPFRDRAGADPAEWPDDLRIQNMPKETR